MRAVAGPVWTPHGWIQGHVLIEAGRILAVEKGPPPVEPAARGVVVPAFANAHTHVGDAVARGRDLPASLEEAVKPPHGFKHRVLASTPEPALVEGMRGALREVERSGAAGFADFREGGARGLAQLRAAGEGLGLATRAYARPAGQGLEGAEVAELLRGADGLSVSSLPDDPRAPALAEAARRAHKGFALHASEGAREPLEPVLDLRPELLVHLTSATRADLERVRDAACKVAVCPRSNARWVRRLPDVRAMLDLGLDVGLGTDNAMLGPSDVLAEARALLDLDRTLRAEDALRLLAAGWRILDPRGPAPPAPGAPAELLVFQARGPRPAEAVLAPDARLLHRERARPRGEPVKPA